MEALKELLFWWMLIYNILIITVKPIRNFHIEYLESIDE